MVHAVPVFFEIGVHARKWRTRTHKGSLPHFFSRDKSRHRFVGLQGNSAPAILPAPAFLLS
jgi:hypothetical protein